MIIGVPKEIKNAEYRVAVTPGGAALLTQAGHRVLVEREAGKGSGFSDEEYARVGAEMVATPEEVYRRGEMVVKVKEPLPPEFPFLRDGLILFTFLHLAAEEELTKELLEKGVASIAYETVEQADGSLPLLTPMSEVAGRMAVQVAAHYLEKAQGGEGLLLGGVPGVSPAEVAILGAGVVGTNAAQMALGLGAHVIIISRGLERLRYLGQVLHGNLTTLASNPQTVADSVGKADVLIGAVLDTGAKAARLVGRKLVGQMKRGSVIVDVSVDQGGCVETSHPTSHTQPTYEVDGVIHYCVTNMPGAVPRTSTLALSNVTLPYVLKLADLGFHKAVQEDPCLTRGVNTYKGHLICRGVGEAFGIPCRPLQALLS